MSTTAPCAYCGRDTPPEEQAPGAGVWEWPGKGMVTNCLSCAGYENCPTCGRLHDNSEGTKGDECFDCQQAAGPYESTTADTSAFAFKFTDWYGGVYEPWTDGHGVGFKVTRDGRSRYLSISPSIGSDDLDDDATCAFIREGETPETDEAYSHFVLFSSKIVEA